MNVPHELENILVAGIQFWLQTTNLYNSQKDASGNNLIGTPTVYRGFPINMAGVINPAIPQFFPHVIVGGENGPANGDGTSRRINSLIFEQTNRKILRRPFGRTGVICRVKSRSHQ